jgi:hypothetical protein
MFLACLIIAFSYIFFEVLDLDGSNLPLQAHFFESLAIVPEVETGIIRPSLTRLAEPWIHVSIDFLLRESEWVRRAPIEKLPAPVFNAFRRWHRASLARSSIPNL